MIRSFNLLLHVHFFFKVTSTFGPLLNQNVFFIDVKCATFQNDISCHQEARHEYKKNASTEKKNAT